MISHDPIHIGLAADARYYPGLFVTAVSIAAHASSGVHLIFNIIDGGIERSKMRELEQAIKLRHADSEIKLLTINANMGASFPEKMNYARLHFPRLLPDVNHLVYCDVDFLWAADVAELWHLRDEFAYVKSVLDVKFSREREARWLKSRGVEIDAEKYFCSGLMLMNLELFRRHQISDKAAAFIKEHPDIPLFDQTALNVILLNVPNGVVHVPCKWQRHATEVCCEDFYSPMVLHYSGLCPWSGMRVVPDIVDLWFKVAAAFKRCNVEDVKGQYYSRIAYTIGRLAFFLLARIPVVKLIALTAAYITRGKFYASYLKGILRRVDAKDKIEILIGGEN